MKYNETKIEKLMSEVNKGHIVEIIKGYCKPILDKIEDIVREEEAVVLDNFYNYIMHDSQGKQEMEKALDKYKEDSSINEYVSQKAINEIYSNFIIRLIDNGEDEHINDDNSIEYLKNILEVTEDYYNCNIKSWLDDFEIFDSYELIGCRVEYSVHKSHDESWENEPCYIISIKGAGGRYYEIEVSESEDYDSYNYDSYGYCELRKVEKLNVTMKAKRERIIKLPRIIDGKDIRFLARYESIDLLEINDTGEFEIEGVVEASYCGGDEYYPEGYGRVNLDVFSTPNARQKYKKVVWVFKGDSASGKTYLSNIIHGSYEKTVYETDTNKELPTILNYNIIVIGNKYDFTVEDVKERIVGDVELVVVDFTIQ